MLFLFIFLLGFVVFILIKVRQHHQIKQLYKQAKALESKSSGRPNDLGGLQEALAIYKQCQKINNNTQHARAVSNCQQKIDDRLQCQFLINRGKKKAKENYFKAALSNFKQAERLVSNNNEVKAEINRCVRGIERQNQYEQVLERANQIAREGRFQTAIDLLTPAVETFSRRDGEDLLNKLQVVVRGKNTYQLGLAAEARGEINNAIALYQRALDLIPEYIDCKYRLAIIAVNNSPQQAISYLTGIEEQQAAYVRGFAHTQLGNWQQAKREWSKIDRPIVINQIDIISDLLEREHLIVEREIEQLVDKDNLDKAKLISIDYLKKHNDNLVVQNNLKNYIQPLLEHQAWQNKDWQEIATIAKHYWRERQDIESLHNWAIATYYQAQVYPHKLPDFIIAWSTALANIQLNPILQDVLWLGGNSIDFEAVVLKLKQILENAIAPVKDNDIEEYFKLRDIYRRDMVMLALAKKDDCGIKTKSQLLVLPNCYQCFQNNFPPTELPANVWGALYTDWGTAIAACQEQDVTRAIKIKPKKTPTLKAEHFACCFIAYHAGCHYLENQRWREAMKYLQEAKPEIRANFNWCSEIDRLCQMQRQQITEFQEHLEFAKLWYLLVGSQPAKAYHVEYRSMQIGMDADERKISFQQALKKLLELQKIDPYNSVTSDLLETLKINLDLEKINYLWQKSEYEAAVQIAMRSPYEKVRFAVAEVCLQIVLEILQSGNLTIESIQSLQKITQWAYELCPHEPLFQSTYSQLQQLGIYP